MNIYFITGATGTLGSAVVRELLTNTSHRLVLLIRAKDETVLQERVEELVSFLEVDDPSAIKRIEAIRGDTEIEKFGLGSKDYSRLGASVTHIIHSAAIVRMNLPIEKARLAAVDATKNIMLLARLCQENKVLQKVEIVSTVGVGGRWQGHLPERWINEPRVFHNTYEQAKAEAEVVIEHYATKEDLPITVHRPSMIVGHSHSGRILHFQIFYHLIEFISGRRTWGMLPNLTHHKVDLVPVDYVAQVIVWSSSSLLTAGKVLHLCSGPEQATSLEELKATVLVKFQEKVLHVSSRMTMPITWFKGFSILIAPFAPNHLKKSLATLPVFLDYLSEDQVFSNVETQKLLCSSDAGLVLPMPTSYLDPVIEYYLMQTYLKLGK